MKNLLLICLFTVSIFGMEKNSELSSDKKFTFRQAVEQDLPELLDLINTQAVHDKNKIVILPKKFREDFLKKAINNGRMFVALDSNNKIIGYKKLFLITDEAEKLDILKNEIRCLGKQIQKKYSGFISEYSEFKQEDLQEDNQDILDSNYPVCIYNGGDFTLPKNRGAGINSKLTDESLQILKPLIIRYLKEKDSNNLSCVFGITDENSGKFPGDKFDRTVTISKSFINFIKSLSNLEDYKIDLNNIVLRHKRYQAFMPTFESESNVLKPLPDEQSIQGNGCVLTYEFVS